MKRQMQAIAVVTAVLLIGITAHSQTTVTNGLVGYWPMDNVRGTELTDHTTTTNHGAFTQGAPTWVSGKFGNGLRLDSLYYVAKRAEIPHHVDYLGTNVFSISLWCKTDKGYRSGNMFSKGALALLYRNSETRFSVYFGSDWALYDTGLGADHVWHHVVFVFDPFTTNGKKLYLDGVLDLSRNAASGIGDTALNTSVIEFRGAGNYNTDNSFDDVAIWDRALTTNEVAYLYNGGTGNIVSDLNLPPSVPTNVAAVASGQSVILSWAANTVDLDFSTYSIYRGLVSGGPYTLVTNNLTVPLHIDTGLVNDTLYHYVIRTVDLRGAESGNSLEVTAMPFDDITPPETPTGLSIESGYDRAYLSWSANTEPDLAGYNVYKALSVGGPFVLTQTLARVTSWVDAGVTNGVTYFYRITAEDVPGNESSVSTVVAVAPGVQDTTPGLVGYWPMDSTSGTNLVDESVTGNDGAFVAGAPSWVAGKFSNALNIDKDFSDRALIPHHAAYNANSTYSISFWIEVIDCYDSRSPFAKGAVFLSNFRRQYHDVRLLGFGVPWSSAATGVAYRNSSWSLFVLVYDPAGGSAAKRLYVNGALISTNMTPGVGVDTALNTDPIGFNPTGSARYDDVAIWDLPLTIDQVESLWNAGDGRTAYTAPPSGTLIMIR